MGQTQQMSLPGLEPQWTLGDRLRKAREVAGLSQTEMAEAIGIARNSVGRYEAGAYEPSRPVMIAWAFRTGVALDWLHGEGSQQVDISGQKSRPAGIPTQPATPGHAPVDNEITRLRKRIPLNPALALVLRMAS
jgi:transcriptional regulator with XRE-family HTH domain